MRSLLFVPGDNQKKLEKALAAGADVLIVDLEDSISPQRKQIARETVADFLREAKTKNAKSKSDCPRLFVRINDLNGIFIEDDLNAIMPSGPDGIVLPKAVGGRDIAQLGVKLAVREAENGFADGATRVLAIATENAAGVFALGTFASANSRLIGIAWGAEDLATDIGASTNREATGNYTAPFLLARQLTLFGAAAASVAAIDGVFTDLRDLEGLKRECLVSYRDGFSAKMAVHPAQIPIINEAFTPSAQEIECARAIVAAFAADPGQGAISLGGKMLDRPHLKQAERLLSRFEK